MAKKVYKIEAFEGGVNTRSDPRDIEENELTNSERILLKRSKEHLGVK